MDTLADVPHVAAPIDAMATTLETVAAFFLERHEHSRQRQAVIVANAELRERELIKLASLSAALATTLRHRGVKDPAATLTAEAGITVFKVGFERWVADDGERPLADFLRESLDELKVVTGEGERGRSYSASPEGSGASACSGSPRPIVMDHRTDEGA